MGGPALGQLLALLSAFCFAGANVFISRTGKSGGDKGVMFSVLMTMMISGALWLLFEAGRRGPSGDDAYWTGMAWFALAGVSAMVFGRTLVFESLRRLGVTRATALKRLHPFFAVLLAALLLSDPIRGLDAVGLVVIALAFLVLIRESFRHNGVGSIAPAPASYLFGVFGAMAYAVAYVVRKIGLEVLDAPALGTFVSAVSGFFLFAVLAIFSSRHRGNFTGMFRHLDHWVVLAAVMVSLGQILLFAALSYEKVSTVVMISSMEIFISVFLSVAVFRTERLPGPAVLVAALLATVGVVLITIT